MEAAAQIDEREINWLKRGLVSGTPIAIGYLPVALTFGLIAGSTGLTVYEAVLMSFLVFAGAAQYMALSMIALGAGAMEIVVSTFIVNFRHLLMSASIHERAERSSNKSRALYSFFLTDEVFAVASTSETPIRSHYILGVGLVAYSSWVGFTGVGYFAGAFLPGIVQESMAIALYALFIALLIPSIKTQGKVVIRLAFLGALFNTVFSIWLSTGWAVMLATILAVVVYEGIEQVMNKGGLK
ncbi:branched-chain amino acid ABC transporter permease [Salipaludibacillus keqinensis]|uniref:Branched-chain amino acid ABC transporter permease n=1 Tax=Salipaludibacillus keqinensis TaxID=2045207 RepID=A0A323TEZ4_9BACI|nr:AzlC family ABC transporter permease [Salipaludibacillus keqinensis]PYZ93548.1 branched-chain amino acid ABC transporter permease [Salipaludibacillus keqinensis]